MHPTSTLIFALLPSCDGLFGLGRLQSITVMGILRCKGKPASKATVKLFDQEIFLDTELGIGKTDQNGTFKLSGSKREFTLIDPFLNIYHKCNYDGLCVRRRKIRIPDKYVTYGSFGSFPNYIFNIGTMNLEEVHADKIDCTDRSISAFRQ